MKTLACGQKVSRHYWMAGILYYIKPLLQHRCQMNSPRVGVHRRRKKREERNPMFSLMVSCKFESLPSLFAAAMPYILEDCTILGNTVLYTKTHGSIRISFIYKKNRLGSNCLCIYHIWVAHHIPVYFQVELLLFSDCQE